VTGGDRPALVAASRELRDALSALPGLFKEAVRILTDSSADPTFRRAIAVVLGSLPGEEGKRVLAKALADHKVDGLERSVILAIGIGEIEDGGIFEREGQPYATEAAPGLFVLVRGAIGDAQARAELSRFLAESPASDVRLASARVLRDSTAQAEVRQALSGRLEQETDAEVLAEAAAALTNWSRAADSALPERGEVLSKVFDRIPGCEEVLRLRLQAPLSSTPFTPEESQRLHTLAIDVDPDARRFAVDVLGRRIGMSAADSELSVPVLRSSVTLDSNPHVRETAALGLGRVATDPQVVQTLAAALQRDADWEVRATAARSLGRAAGSEAARQALQTAAANDPREEVRSSAQRSLSSLK
jgi:HEAT repeat protein